MKNRNNKGFTLAELLIVIAIIAILIAIAVPVFSSSMKRANEATDCANIRALKAAAVAYYLDESAKGTFTANTKLVLDADGQAKPPSGTGAATNPIKYKLKGSENTQVGALGIATSDANWDKNDSIQCTIDANGGVNFKK